MFSARQSSLHCHFILYMCAHTHLRSYSTSLRGALLDIVGAREHSRNITRTASRKCVLRLLANHILPEIWKMKEAIFMITKVLPEVTTHDRCCDLGLLASCSSHLAPDWNTPFDMSLINVPDAVTRALAEGGKLGWKECLWYSENPVTGNQESFLNSILKSPFHHRLLVLSAHHLFSDFFSWKEGCDHESYSHFQGALDKYSREYLLILSQ